jgi:phosphatidylglycerol:prolipoprotein diacylglycerol transferase
MKTMDVVYALLNTMFAGILPLVTSAAGVSPAQIDPSQYLAFPQIDPVALQIGPITIRWYALAYLAGLTGGWLYIRALAKRLRPIPITKEQIDDLLGLATLGVILGGRLGYVLFYKPMYFLEHPLEIPQMWNGGMSFHGGLLGVILTVIIFCRLKKVPLLQVGDLVACAAPLGLLFGRLANFVNGELYGRVALQAEWAMIFPRSEGLPRHPSQLYEATLEGLALFLVLFFLFQIKKVRLYPGILIGVFLIGYGCARSIVEMYREPDSFLGFIIADLTMGQLLSFPMVLIGLAFIAYALKHPKQSPQTPSSS